MPPGTLLVDASLELRQTALMRRSAKAVPWSVEFEREIGPEDLALLHSSFRVGPSNPTAPLANIREPHHMLAQMVAKEEATVKISAVTGYSPQRIRQLQNDPAFSELVEHYREQEKFDGADIQAQVRYATMIANAILLERLEDEPTSFSNKELREIRDAGLDRIGHGPKATVDHNINDPTNVINKLKEMLSLEGRGKIIARNVIDAEYNEITHEQTETSPRLANSETDADGALLGTEAERPGSGGDSLSEESPQIARSA